MAKRDTSLESMEGKCTTYYWYYISTIGPIDSATQAAGLAVMVGNGSKLVMVGSALLWQTQPPPSPQDGTEVTGGAVQNGLGVQKAEVTVVVAFSRSTVSALISAGMTWPVLSRKGLCPITRKMDVISPEWLVKLR